MKDTTVNCNERYWQQRNVYGTYYKSYAVRSLSDILGSVGASFCGTQLVSCRDTFTHKDILLICLRFWRR